MKASESKADARRIRYAEKLISRGAGSASTDLGATALRIHRDALAGKPWQPWQPKA